METPTTAQLRIAVEVLIKLSERLNIEAACSVVQLPASELGLYYAKNIEARTTEQTRRIEAVTAQLKNWRDELLETTASCARPGRRANRASGLIRQTYVGKF